MIDVGRYLERIGYSGTVDVSVPTLRELHIAHLLAVPFENLDIHLGRPIILDDQALYRKIVENHRGGFCYELNGLFAALLREIGFDVVKLAAGVAREDGDFDPYFDHMTLMVRLGDRWLADVGFGDSFREPLLLDEENEQHEPFGAYRIEHQSASLVLRRRAGGDSWKPEYRFLLQPFEYPDFEELCRYHQTSPDSPFTRGRVCSLATPEGRVTLRDMRFITTVGEEREERLLASQDEYHTLLKELFGIEISDSKRTEA
jgi:N-hydroxyarylamine O-acetyltransferase